MIRLNLLLETQFAYEFTKNISRGKNFTPLNKIILNTVTAKNSTERAQKRKNIYFERIFEPYKLFGLMKPKVLRFKLESLLKRASFFREKWKWSLNGKTNSRMEAQKGENNHRGK